jgi:antitoxin ParD1/3/4
MTVSLTPELEKFVSAEVGSGRYNSASEVVRESLRLLEEHDFARAAQLAGFNGELGRRLGPWIPARLLTRPRAAAG